MAKKTDGELEAMFGISAERIAEIDEAASRGDLPGKAAGPTIHRKRGRPALFGEPTSSITFKVSRGDAERIDKRAAQLGFGRSDYLRSLVNSDLATA